MELLELVIVVVPKLHTDIAVGVEIPGPEKRSPTAKSPNPVNEEAVVFVELAEKKQ